MKQQRPRIKKAKKEPTRERKRGDAPKITTPWGRGASEYRPGKFTKQYFEKHGEACASEIYRALSRAIEHLNEERVYIGETRIRRPNYSSFNRYAHWFLILGLIERTGRSEPARYNFLRNRVFYRLTEKGRSESRAWEDPIGAVHPEHRHRRS